VNRRERRAKGVPRYVKKLTEALGDVQLPPGLHVVRIQHDDWCPFLAGTGPCTCNVEIRLPPELGEGKN
jgi:hypothetical protein